MNDKGETSSAQDNQHEDVFGLGGGKLLLESEELEKKQVAEQKESGQEQPKDSGQGDGENGKDEQPLILGRFKAQQDLEKGYTELQKDYTRKTQELSELKKQITTKPPEEKPKEPTPEPVMDDPDKFYQDLLSNPEKALKPIVEKLTREKLAPIEEKNKKTEEEIQVRESISGFKETHPDMDTYKIKMGEILERDFPRNLKMDNIKLIEMLYKLAKAETIGQVVEEANKNNQNELHDKNKKAFIENGGNASARNTTTKTTPEDDIRNSIVNAKTNNPLFE